MKAGFIMPVVSKCNFPIIRVGKADGTEMFCFDFRCLKERTLRHNYLLPHINDILDGMRVAQVFSKIDIFSGYWQVRNIHLEVSNLLVPSAAIRTTKSTGNVSSNDV